MNEEGQQQIRELAYSLWQSAERPYWTALEYWLMAEQMILGMAFFTKEEGRRRLASYQTVEDPPPARPGAAALAPEKNGARGQSFENMQSTGNSLRL